MSDALPKEWRCRVIAATRDLIITCGGAERCAQLLGIHPGSVYRWKYGKDMIPLLSAMVLEQDCGRPYVTEAMAAFSGRTLSEPQAADAPGGDVLAAHNELMGAFVEVTSAVVDAKADGRFTSADAERVDREAGDLDRKLDDFRETLAGHKAGVVPMRRG